MTEQIKFTLKDGSEITVDPKLMRGYYSEAAKALKAEADAKVEFKDIIETVVENTGLSKRLASKYFKAKYKQATSTDKEIGEVFETLDEALK